MADLFRYPDPVNENAARMIAAGVLALAVAFLITGSGVVLGVMAYGFVVRVLAGPALSPLARIVNRLLVPWLSIPVKLVPGPPKRFAQGIGAVLSVGAVLARFTGLDPLAFVLVAAIGLAATLESVLAFCVGCWIFGHLMAAGLVPTSVCEACNKLAVGESEEPGSARSSIG